MLPDGAREASEALAENHHITERIQRVLDLAEGYESAYGLELLASVHWMAARHGSSNDLSGVTNSVQSWSQRKRRMFTAQHIESAWQRLHDHGWLTTRGLAAPGRRSSAAYCITDALRDERSVGLMIELFVDVRALVRWLDLRTLPRRGRGTRRSTTPRRQGTWQGSPLRPS